MKCAPDLPIQYAACTSLPLPFYYSSSQLLLFSRLFVACIFVFIYFLQKLLWMSQLNVSKNRSTCIYVRIMIWVRLV